MKTNKPLRTGDLLKAEASEASRISIATDKAVKIGQPVLFPLRNQYLIALSDSTNGKVLVQPHNCTINLDLVAEDDITAIGDDEVNITVEEFIKQGDAYGIRYIGTPYVDPNKIPL